MNSIHVAGLAKTAPLLRHTQDKQIPVCEFRMAVCGFKTDDPPFEFDVLVFGEKANLIANKVTPGTILDLSGSVQIDTVEGADGIKRKKATIIASQITSLQRVFDIVGALGQSTPAPAPAPAAAPAQVQAPAPQPAPAQENYDDIPF